MSQTRYVMIGYTVFAPIQPVIWSVYDTPDYGNTTGLSGYPVGQLSNIGISYQETIPPDGNTSAGIKWANTPQLTSPVAGGTTTVGDVTSAISLFVDNSSVFVSANFSGVATNSDTVHTQLITYSIVYSIDNGATYSLAVQNFASGLLATGTTGNTYVGAALSTVISGLSQSSTVFVKAQIQIIGQGNQLYDPDQATSGGLTIIGGLV